MTTKQNQNYTPAQIGVGLGLAAAAAAGAYFLYGSKEGSKRRAKIKGWALKAKGEVLEKMEQAKELNERVYHDLVDGVMERYEKVKSIDPAELVALGQDLKSHWRNISRQLKAPVKPATRRRSPPKPSA